VAVFLVAVVVEHDAVFMPHVLATGAMVRRRVQATSLRTLAATVCRWRSATGVRPTIHRRFLP
jgi:hypothetical protein